MTVEGRTYAFYQGKPRGLGALYWRFWQAPDKDRYELTKERDIINLYVGDKGYETTYKGTVTIDPKLTRRVPAAARSFAGVGRPQLAAGAGHQ